jgi:hypothetical protein
MIDIVTISSDLNTYDAENAKAANVLSIQQGSLEYAPDFGVDIKFFLDPNFQFQNSSFKAYLIQRLAEHHVNVNQVLETVDRLFLKYTFIVGNEKADATGGGFIK